jgi:predicted amidohydrolase
MKISVIQQGLNFDYDYRKESPSLLLLRDKAERRIDECITLIEKAASEGSDLAVTTETVNACTVLGDTRFAYTDIYEGIDGGTVKRFAETAKRLNMYIVAGLLLTIDEKAYNCAVLFDRNGDIVGIHRKVHLPAGEELHVSAGDRYDVFPTEFGNIGMLVCWDMQYPEAARELALGGADLICCPTLGWENIYGLCRAYENSVTIAAAMCSFNASAPTLCGPSCIVDNMGGIVAAAEVGAVCALTAEVDILKEPVHQYNSQAFYASKSMRETRFSQRRPDTYRLQGLPNSNTPLYSRYFDANSEK